MMKTTSHTALRLAVLCLCVFLFSLVGCAGKSRTPDTPPVEVPVSTVEEPEEPEPVQPAVKETPTINEENLGQPASPAPEPAPEVTIAQLMEENLPPRKRAALGLVSEATLLLESEKIEAAIRRLEKAISLDSSSGYAYYYLALVRFKQGRLNQALPLCGQAYLKLKDDRYFQAKSLALRGEVYLAMGNKKKARRDCASALSIDPGNRDALALKKKF